MYLGSNEGVLCHAKHMAGGARAEGDGRQLDREREGSFSLHHIFNIQLSLVAVSCTFKLAYIFYNQNLHEEASSVCELLCKWLQTADAYACPEIPPERVSACLMLLAKLNRTELNHLVPGPGEQRRGWEQLLLLEQPQFPAPRSSLRPGVEEGCGTGHGMEGFCSHWALKPVLCGLPTAAQMLQAAGGKLPQAGAAGESPGMCGAVAGCAAGPDWGAAGRAHLPLGQSQNRCCETGGRGVTITVRPGGLPGAWGVEVLKAAVRKPIK